MSGHPYPMYEDLVKCVIYGVLVLSIWPGTLACHDITNNFSAAVLNMFMAIKHHLDFEKKIILGSPVTAGVIAQ